MNVTLIARWALNAVALMLVPELVDGLAVTSYTTALISALLLGLVNALIRPVLILITLPITVLTLGIFTLVINGLLFWLVSGLVAGGGPGACNIFSYDRDGSWDTPPLASKMTGLEISRGQRLRLESPGGGGYGDAFERAPDAVAEDVRLGYVSCEAAARDYGVALNDAGHVDEAATTAQRAAARR